MTDTTNTTSPQKSVKIYSTPTCHFCAMAKNYFNEKGVAFESVDVLSNLEARKEMVDKSGQLGVPVIDIGGNIVVGFDQGRISDLLGI